jgi:hypothetical protein
VLFCWPSPAAALIATKRTSVSVCRPIGLVYSG